MRQQFSLRNKMLLLFVPLLTISYFFLSLAANRIFVKRLVTQFWGDIKNESTLVSTRLSSVFEATSNCAKYINFDFNYRDTGENLLQKKDPQEKLDQGWTLHNQLYQYSFIFPEIDSLALIDLDSNLYSSSYSLSINWSEQAAAEVQALLDSVPIQDIWFPFEERSFLLSTPGTIPLTLGRKVIDIRSGQKICSLIINLSEEKICSIYSGLETKDLNSYYVTTSEGIIVSASDKSKIMTRLNNESLLSMISSGLYGQAEISMNDEPILATVTPIFDPDLCLVSLHQAGSVTQSADQLSLMFLFTCFIIMAVSIIIVNFFSRRITDSLAKLTNEMDKVKNGNFKISLNIKSGDEIEALANNFHIMLTHIDHLFQQLAATEKQKMESQMKLMQSQIKPHFLYNTLDLVYVLDSMGQTEKAMISVKALADFYRTALSGGEEIIYIRDEIRNAENYLKLQCMRHSDVFDYAIIVDPNILKCEIPKLTLQPIVENAILHGLRHRESKGKLVITGGLQNDYVFLCVEDNGIGIPADILEQIEKGIQNGKGHFGLCNTNSRLKLYFGESCGLLIESEKDVGTRITVKLEARKQIHEK